MLLSKMEIEADYIIKVNPSKTYQQMDGFGASLTDASAWLIYNILSDAERKDLMKKLFDSKEGIGIFFLRQPMGQVIILLVFTAMMI